MTKQRICWRSLVAVVCQLLVCHLALAQQRGLRVVVVQGDGAKNVVQQIPAEALMVRVEDSRGSPVDGATVSLSVPDAGPGGRFSNDSSSVTMTTNSDGLVVVEGFHPNDLAGDYRIRVRAEFQNESALGLISQTNMASRKSHRKLITILSVAGAAVGAALIARGGGDANSPTPVPFGNPLEPPRR